MFERNLGLSKAARIERLEIGHARLDKLDDARWLQLAELRADLERLTKYLGLKFENVNERRLVEVSKPDEEI